jgi:hypothetical protein
MPEEQRSCPPHRPRTTETGGPDWHADPYVLSPGPKSLLTLFDAEHGLGGISGYDVAETTDENPDRVAAVQQLTWAYLRTQLYPGRFRLAGSACRADDRTQPARSGRIQIIPRAAPARTTSRGTVFPFAFSPDTRA